MAFFQKAWRRGTSSSSSSETPPDSSTSSSEESSYSDSEAQTSNSIEDVDEFEANLRHACDARTDKMCYSCGLLTENVQLNTGRLFCNDVCFDDFYQLSASRRPRPASKTRRTVRQVKKTPLKKPPKVIKPKTERTLPARPKRSLPGGRKVPKRRTPTTPTEPTTSTNEREAKLNASKQKWKDRFRAKRDGKPEPERPAKIRTGPKPVKEPTEPSTPEEARLLAKKNKWKDRYRAADKPKEPIEPVKEEPEPVAKPEGVKAEKVNKYKDKYRRAKQDAKDKQAASTTPTEEARSTEPSVEPVAVPKPEGVKPEKVDKYKEKYRRAKQEAKDRQPTSTTPTEEARRTPEPSSSTNEPTERERRYQQKYQRAKQQRDEARAGRGGSSSTNEPSSSTRPSLVDTIANATSGGGAPSNGGGGFSPPPYVPPSTTSPVDNTPVIVPTTLPPVVQPIDRLPADRDIPSVVPITDAPPVTVLPVIPRAGTTVIDTLPIDGRPGATTVVDTSPLPSRGGDGRPRDATTFVDTSPLPSRDGDGRPRGATTFVDTSPVVTTPLVVLPTPCNTCPRTPPPCQTCPYVSNAVVSTAGLLPEDNPFYSLGLRGPNYWRTQTTPVSFGYGAWWATQYPWARRYFPFQRWFPLQRWHPYYSVSQDDLVDYKYGTLLPTDALVLDTQLFNASPALPQLPTFPEIGINLSVLSPLIKSVYRLSAREKQLIRTVVRQIEAAWQSLVGNALLAPYIRVGYLPVPDLDLQRFMWIRGTTAI